MGHYDRRASSFHLSFEATLCHTFCSSYCTYAKSMGNFPEVPQLVSGGTGIQNQSQTDIKDLLPFFFKINVLSLSNINHGTVSISDNFLCLESLNSRASGDLAYPLMLLSYNRWRQRKSVIHPGVSSWLAAKSIQVFILLWYHFPPFFKPGNHRKGTFPRCQIFQNKQHRVCACRNSGHW